MLEIKLEAIATQHRETADDHPGDDRYLKAAYLLDQLAQETRAPGAGQRARLYEDASAAHPEYLHEIIDFEVKSFERVGFGWTPNLQELLDALMENLRRFD